MFFVAAVGLVPGTLCARFEGSELTVHRIGRAPAGRSLRRLEDRVADLFGEPR